MSIEQAAEAGPDGDTAPPGPWVQPADLAEFDDAVEESLFEAAACGDLGFADRVFTGWWPEIEDTVPPDWAPADPIERFGRVGWLQSCARELNEVSARFLAAVHQGGHAQSRYDAQGYPCRDVSGTDEVAKALGHSPAMAGTWLALAVRHEVRPGTVQVLGPFGEKAPTSAGSLAGLMCVVLVGPVRRGRWIGRTCS